MAIAHYLAMTGAEMAAASTLPQHTAWMACHFSPYGSGLSNLPQWLPPASVLILNDRTPIHDHDPVLIAAQLEACVQQFSCIGLLLDFQRPGEAQTPEVVQHLCQSLPCPVAVSEPYANGETPIVFLPPPPPDTPLSVSLSPWNGQEIWLDTTLEGLELTLTEEGAASTPVSPWDCPAEGFPEPRLHCHYQTKLEENCARFTLWRTPEDLDSLLAEAETLGVAAAVGLYQEFYKISPFPSRKRDADYLRR